MVKLITLSFLTAMLCVFIAMGLSPFYMTGAAVVLIIGATAACIMVIAIGVDMSRGLW